MIKKINADVLIVGCGAAGLKAAVTIKELEKDAEVIVVSKGKAGKCGTTANAISDRMAFHATLKYTLPEKNNWKYHAQDIVKIGRFVSDWNLAEILARESEDVFNYLCSIGVPFVKRGEKYDQFLTDGSTYPRACYTGPFTAIDIERKLFERAKQIEVRFIENCKIVEIIVEKNKVKGAVGLNKKGDFFLFNTSFIILATGGAGRIFKRNCYPAGMTGDGYSLALKAGAELVNMEFIQIGTCIKKLKVASSGSFMRSLPRLVDKNDKEILFDYYPPLKVFEIIFRKGASWPVSYEEETKIIDILTYRKKTLFLDYTKNSKFLQKENIPEKVRNWYLEKGIKEFEKILPYERLKLINPEIYNYLEKKGLDPSKNKIEVFEAVQHFQGGVKIGEWGQTEIEGLFACGECAGGQHGANRPGGNALLDTQVFGKRAGIKVVEMLAKNKDRSRTVEFDLEQLKGKIKDDQLNQIHNRIKNLMDKYVMIERRYEDLERIFEDFTEIYKRIKRKKGENPYLYFETESMLLTSLAVIKGCLLRKESRGPHLLWKNSEILPSDEKFDNKYICIRLYDGEIGGKIKSVKRSERWEK